MQFEAYAYEGVNANARNRGRPDQRNLVRFAEYVTPKWIVIPSEARNLFPIEFEKQQILAPKSGARNDNPWGG